MGTADRFLQSVRFEVNVTRFCSFVEHGDWYAVARCVSIVCVIMALCYCDASQTIDICRARAFVKCRARCRSNLFFYCAVVHCSDRATVNAAAVTLRRLFSR